MTPDYWQKIRKILDGALEMEPARRPEYLEAACGGDTELYSEVESLLEFDNDDSDPLEQGVFSFITTEIETTARPSLTGTQVGNYLILDELGSGGMGSVFLAERADGAFAHQVALKLIKRGMDSDAVLGRFLNERRILASLEHPNIARLFDGGTTEDGLPFFAMECVRGRQVIEYANDEGLGVEDRLRLFREICSAVSYAHQKLVIHRDLKPSNILVGSDGVPKLLDFGIAKVLNVETGGMATMTQQFVLTPEYASPEQVRGEQLTTATDVYSLGIILYEMLTGERPFKTANTGYNEIVRVICETSPARPSSIVRSLTDPATNPVNIKPPPANLKALRGDLDNIILKAIRKEPERRYSSVEQFSEDIRRHLSGLPVSASSDAFRYRATKFIRRHRIAVAAAGLILLSLLAGLGATLYQARIARRERAKAEQRFNDVRQLANSFMFEINQKITESPIQARELLVTRALEYLDKLAQEAGDDTELQIELATAYEKIGLIQADLFSPGLGKTSEALASHQKALQIRERLRRADPKDIMRGLEVLKSRMYIGGSLSTSGQLGEAREEYHKGVELGEELMLVAPKDKKVRLSLAWGHALLGQALLRSGSLGSVLENYERSLELYREVQSEYPDEPILKRNVAVVYDYIGYVKMEMLQFDEAEAYFGKELAISKEVLAADENNSQYRTYLGNAHLWIGFAQREAGRLDEGIANMEIALSVHKAVFAADPGDFSLRNNLADCYLELGKGLTKKKDFDAASLNLNKAIEHYGAVAANDPQNISARRQVVLTRRNLADNLTEKGETQKAFALYREALTDYAELIRDDPDNTEWQDDLAVCNLRTGENLLKRNDRAAALPYFQSAVNLFEKLISESPENA
ncbi:MAG TPA: serine/threonine-protein kinase, partial [Nitrosospira sp.]|nr:serine/threonine-protein kinase [Nitrosospira sp.]